MSKMKDEIKLKPCPFCGTLPETWWDITQPAKEGFNIACPQCKIPTVNQIFKKESIEIWNDRAGSIEVGVEELETIIGCSELGQSAKSFCVKHSDWMKETKQLAKAILNNLKEKE